MQTGHALRRQGIDGLQSGGLEKRGVPCCHDHHVGRRGRRNCLPGGPCLHHQPFAGLRSRQIEIQDPYREHGQDLLLMFPVQSVTATVGG